MITFTFSFSIQKFSKVPFTETEKSLYRLTISFFFAESEITIEGMDLTESF